MEERQRQIQPSTQTLPAFAASEGPIPNHEPSIGPVGQGDNPARTLRRIRFAIARRARHLRLVRFADRLSWTIPMRGNAGICSFEITTTAGFFAQLNWCLFIFQYCELHALIPDIRLASLYRDPDRGPNWLDYYFDISRPMPSEEVARRVRYTKKLGDLSEWGSPTLPAMSVEEGSRIMHKYLRIKPHITALVDDFWKRLGVNGPVVGIHFRGTDKTEEAPRVSWEHCLQTLQTYIQNDKNIKAVFVASDEQKFIDFVVTSMKDVPVYSHDDHYRTCDRRPVHMSGGGGYEKGEDALVNALLLSRCSTVIRTTSFLSAWASIFNPRLKIILLNKPYDRYFWYPETEIMRSPNTTYLPERPSSS